MAKETLELLIWLLPLPPLVAFAVILLFTRKSHLASTIIGVGAAFLSFIGSVIILVNALWTGSPSW